MLRYRKVVPVLLLLSGILFFFSLVSLASSVGGYSINQVLQTVSHSETDGLLVYKFGDLKDGHWQLLERFELSKNLLQNPRLERDDAVVNDRSAQAQAPFVDHWVTPPYERVQDSTFSVEHSGESNAIGVTAGYDRQAVWSTDLPDCRPGARYLFSAEFLRGDRCDVLAYPEISLWGQQYRLNTHRIEKKYQKLKAILTCPASYSDDERKFQFHNKYPGNSFWMRNPELVEIAGAEQAPKLQTASNFFPIGTYGAHSKNLEEIKKLGLNTAVVALNRQNVEKCLSINMHCTLSVPRDPENLILALDELESLLNQDQFSYYVNDEPGIHSFPEWKAEDTQRIIKQRFPKSVTNMAIVRPQAVPFYEKAADYFMLDQYPVPNMPMTWLSDSMDEAAIHVGRDRLQSVIQAFGGEKYATGGWPRLPTFEEMNCLAFLSVIHGSRGIYFYTFPSITSTKQGKEDFARLIRSLNSVRSWLEVYNDEEKVSLQMTSEYRVDPRGNPAVHCTFKEQYNTKMLICVNTLNTYAEAEIDIPSERSTHWRGYFKDTPYPVVDGTILTRFKPLEVKVLMENK